MILRVTPRLRSGLVLGASALGLLLGSCNQRLDFDVPDATAGASGASHGGAAGEGARGGCARDSDCGLASLHCNLASAACVECLLDVDCAVLGLARCDGAIHRCVECGLDADCLPEQKCDPTSRRCLQRCREDVDCSGQEHRCESARGVCIECDDADDCATGSSCIRGGLCAACEGDGDCGELFCDPVRRDCIECRDSIDCGAGRACDPSSHRCQSL